MNNIDVTRIIVDLQNPAFWLNAAALIQMLFAGLIAGLLVAGIFIAADDRKIARITRKNHVGRFMVAAAVAIILVVISAFVVPGLAPVVFLIVVLYLVAAAIRGLWPFQTKDDEKKFHWEVAQDKGDVVILELVNGKGEVKEAVRFSGLPAPTEVVPAVVVKDYVTPTATTPATDTPPAAAATTTTVTTTPATTASP